MRNEDVSHAVNKSINAEEQIAKEISAKSNRECHFDLDAKRIPKIEVARMA